MTFQLTCSGALGFALSMMLAGCSGDATSEEADSGVVAGTDAGSESTPASWTVHVDVRRVAGPVPVLVSHPDGSVYGVTQTDASGKVDVEVPHLGSVSVLTSVALPSGSPLLRRVATYSKVDSNGTFDTETMEAYSGNHLGKLTFVPSGALPSGTESVRVALACGGEAENQGDASSAITFADATVCEGVTEYFAVAWALDASGKALAATVVEHLPAVPGEATYEFDFTDPQAFALFQPEVSPFGEDVTRVQARVLGRFQSGTPRAMLDTTATIDAPLAGKIPALPALTEYFPELELSLSVTFAEPPNGPYRPVASRWLRTSTFPPKFALDLYELAPIESISPVEALASGRPKLMFSIAPGEVGNCVGARVFWSEAGVGGLWIDERKLESSGVFQMPELPASLAEFAPSSASELSTWGAGVSHSLEDEECSRMRRAS